jgi:hypothetical protein
MTIAQQLKVKEFPFIIKDSNSNVIYYEGSNGYWSKGEYDSDGNMVYYEKSDGYWSKSEFDSNGRVIYYEDPYGTIIDNRPKSEVQKAIELLEKKGLIVDGKILKA